MHVAEAEFAISLVLLFALSLLAVYVGVAAIVGAFSRGWLWRNMWNLGSTSWRTECRN